MGRPVHYSTDVPERCNDLIKMLVSRVEEDEDSRRKWGGPLKTTFLLAMATPMLVLPMERMFKSLVQGKPGVASDAELDRHVDAKVAEVLGAGRTFENAPFFVDDAWHFVPFVDRFNVANHWPNEVLKELDSKESEKCARRADASEILSLLRNAIAHGGVTYLDRNGRQVEFASNMLAFASKAWIEDKRGLSLLRVPVSAFQTFLSSWAGWLCRTGIATDLTNRGPGYFEKDAA